MQLKNSADRFGVIAILFHWVMAIIIIFLLCLGLYMADLPVGLSKLKYYGLHKELGMLVLFLVSLRIIWREMNITPALKLPPLEKFAARAMHFLFYIVMFAMPITGWLVTSAAGLSVSFFGLFTIPTIISADPVKLEWLEEVHGWLAYALIAMIVLHVIAALKHHFIDKDDILRRMIS